ESCAYAVPGGVTRAGRRGASTGTRLGARAAHVYRRRVAGSVLAAKANPAVGAAARRLPDHALAACAVAAGPGAPARRAVRQRGEAQAVFRDVTLVAAATEHELGRPVGVDHAANEARRGVAGSREADPAIARGPIRARPPHGLLRGAQLAGLARIVRIRR